MGLPQDKQKLATGKALIRYFCTPCKPTKGQRGEDLEPAGTCPGKWELFKEYCRQDVVTEKAILRRLEMFPMPEEEEKLWQMDVRMNAYGVRVDTGLIGGALSIHERSTEELSRKAACHYGTVQSKQHGPATGVAERAGDGASRSEEGNRGGNAG